MLDTFLWAAEKTKFLDFGEYFGIYVKVFMLNVLDVPGNYLKIVVDNNLSYFNLEMKARVKLLMCLIAFSNQYFD
jgi:hypothetical protein